MSEHLRGASDSETPQSFYVERAPINLEPIELDTKTPEDNGEVRISEDGSIMSVVGSIETYDEVIHIVKENKANKEIAYYLSIDNESATELKAGESLDVYSDDSVIITRSLEGGVYVYSQNINPHFENTLNAYIKEQYPSTSLPTDDML